MVIRDIVRRNHSNVSEVLSLHLYLFLLFTSPLSLRQAFFQSVVLFVSHITVQRSVPSAAWDMTGILLQVDTYKAVKGDSLF